MLINGDATPVIAGLAIGIAFIALFSVSTFPFSSYKPRLSEEQAISVLANHLKEKWNGFINYGIYTPEGYLEYDQFRARGYHVPLVFVHNGGTQFFVNSTTYEVDYRCVNFSPIMCGYSPNFVNEARGHLVYAFDISVRTDSKCDGSDFFIVDAMDGDILFSFIGERPESVPERCINQNT